MCNQKVETSATRVCIVEDESIVALDLQFMLEALGFSIVGLAETAAEAVRMVSEMSPDIVLMDIILPGGMDGIDAAEQIRMFSSVPIVFCTANSDVFTRSRAERIPVTGYLMKPVSPKTLEKAVRALVFPAGH